MASKAATKDDLDALVSGLDGADGGGEGRAAGKSGAKKLLLIVVPLLVVLLGAGGAWYMGMLDSLLGKSAEEEAHAAAETAAAQHAPDPVFYDLPDMLVNLQSTGTRAAYLKIKLALQFSDPAVTPVLQKLQPRLIDSFQIYLRELRLSDLEGSAGVMRLKEELLARANQLMAPAVIDDVLFKEMLVQ